MVPDQMVSHLMKALNLQNAGGWAGFPTDQPVDWQPMCHGVPCQKSDWHQKNLLIRENKSKENITFEWSNYKITTN